MNDYGWIATYLFIGVYILMAFDFVFNHNGILIAMLGLMTLGMYYGIKWIIVKRKVEKYYTINPLSYN